MAKVITKRGFIKFMESIIEEKMNAGRIRTAEYESYLRDRGVSPNSSSFYMRTLRAVYNRAVENGFEYLYL